MKTIISIHLPIPLDKVADLLSKISEVYPGLKLGPSSDGIMNLCVEGDKVSKDESPNYEWIKGESCRLKWLGESTYPFTTRVNGRLKRLRVDCHSPYLKVVKVDVDQSLVKVMADGVAYQAWFDNHHIEYY